MIICHSSLPVTWWGGRGGGFSSNKTGLAVSIEIRLPWQLVSRRLPGTSSRRCRRPWAYEAFRVALLIVGSYDVSEPTEDVVL
jgi:hypothetical protein